MGDDALDSIHVPDNVVEGDNLRVADSLARVHRAKRWKSVEHRVRELVAGNVHNDPLELVRVDVSVIVLIEEVERLAKPLALVTLDELGEFLVCTGSANDPLRRLSDVQPTTCRPPRLPT